MARSKANADVIREVIDAFNGGALTPS